MFSKRSLRVLSQGFSRVYSTKGAVAETAKVASTGIKPVYSSQYSELNEAEHDVINGIPEKAIKNSVYIYQPCYNTMQSGKNNTKYWTIDFSTLAKGHRWENQLIGWQGTSDNMQAVKLRFFTLQQAIDYATRHGLEYSVKQPTSPKFKVKTYKQNFVYNPDKLRMIYTK